MREWLGLRVPPELLSLRLFGSFARGDSDANSDLDVLVVLKKSVKPSAGEMEGLIQEIFHKTATLTYYSYARMVELHRQGHLFAWHIYLESKELLSAGNIDVIQRLGPPAKYISAYRDVNLLRSILLSIEGSIVNCPRNIVYEAGLAYVCCRNIALVVSTYNSSFPDFSRYSPYNVSFLDYLFPISRSQYDLWIQSRHSGMRGAAIPTIDKAKFLDDLSQAELWTKQAHDYITNYRKDKQ